MGKADGIVRCSKTCFNEKPPVQYCALVPSLVIIKLMTVNYDVEIGSQVEKVQNSITNKRQREKIWKKIRKRFCTQYFPMMSASKVPYMLMTKLSVDSPT